MRLVSLAGALLLFAASAGAAPVPADWSPFWAQFKAAVQHQDRAAIRQFMAPNINFQNSAAPTADSAMQDLADPQVWADLKSTIAKAPKPTSKSTGAHPQMSVYMPPAAGEERGYGVELVFDKGASGWKWTWLNYPGD